MSASNAFETAILQLILNNAALANIGDASGLQPSAADGSLYVSLHTASPGEAGDQTTSEATYTSYARVAVTRDGTGWSIASGAASNAAEVAFPTATGGTNTITHVGVGTAASGAGNLLLYGALDASLSVSNGVTPSFAIGALDLTCE